MPRKGGNFFIERKRKSVSRAKTHIKERLYSEKSFHERKCRPQRRKRFYRANTFLVKAKRVYLAKTCPGKTETLFTEKKTTQAKAKKRLPTENVAHKGGSAFTELIRSMQRRTRVCLAKTCPGKAETLFTERNDASKGERAFTEEKTFPERKRNSERLKSLYRAKTSLA